MRFLNAFGLIGVVLYFKVQGKVGVFSIQAMVYIIGPITCGGTNVVYNGYQTFHTMVVMGVFWGVASMVGASFKIGRIVLNMLSHAASLLLRPLGKQ